MVVMGCISKRDKTDNYLVLGISQWGNWNQVLARWASGCILQSCPGTWLSPSWTCQSAPCHANSTKH
jgi:hypothetical protein